MIDARVGAVGRLIDHAVAVRPHTTAVALEAVEPDEAAGLLAGCPPAAAARVLEHMAPASAAPVIVALGAGEVGAVLGAVAAPRAASILSWLEPEPRERLLDRLGGTGARELRELLAYPPDTAGALMDPRVIMARRGQTAGEVLAALRDVRHALHELPVVDDEHRLVGAVPLHRLALAAPDARVATLADPAAGAVAVTTTREELVEFLARTGLPSIGVVDDDGRLIGMLRHAALVGAAEAEAVADLQRMVGASVDEKALSSVGFAVKKRLVWLHVNLLTAFLAAAVVGIFESTIATVSALAVLLPVVAGQSGNSGAQAMAVTMRGLAMREVRGSHWRRLALKEVLVGTINGAAIAVSAGVGVLVWSGSYGLAVVIATSMVVAMAAANFAGMSIPIVLKQLGQDPAQSASIFLTTVTDVVGFMVFLGMATAAIQFL